jgi:hypothetical protein
LRQTNASTWLPVNSKGKTGLEKVAAIGCGVMLCKAEVFQEDASSLGSGFTAEVRQDSGRGCPLSVLRLTMLDLRLGWIMA